MDAEQRNAQMNAKDQVAKESKLGIGGQDIFPQAVRPCLSKQLLSIVCGAFATKYGVQTGLARTCSIMVAATGLRRDSRGHSSTQRCQLICGSAIDHCEGARLVDHNVEISIWKFHRASVHLLVCHASNLV